MGEKPGREDPGASGKTRNRKPGGGKNQALDRQVFIIHKKH